MSMMAPIAEPPELKRFSGPQRAAALMLALGKDHGAPIWEQLSVDEIKIDVQNLEAHIALNAQLANLLKLNAGADIGIERVNVQIKGVKAQALLKVRLDNVAAIIDRTWSTICTFTTMPFPASCTVTGPLLYGWPTGPRLMPWMKDANCAVSSAICSESSSSCSASEAASAAAWLIRSSTWSASWRTLASRCSTPRRRRRTSAAARKRRRRTRAPMPRPPSRATC